MKNISKRDFLQIFYHCGFQIILFFSSEQCTALSYDQSTRRCVFYKLLHNAELPLKVNFTDAEPGQDIYVHSSSKPPNGLHYFT